MMDRLMVAIRLAGGLLLVPTVAVLPACGRDDSGSVGITSVALTLMMPDSAADADASRAKSDLEAPTGVAAVSVRVTEASGLELASATATAAPGQDVTITLAVPAGPGRIFIVRAVDGNGRTLFQGRASADLTPGVPATLSIAMARVQISITPPTAALPPGATQTFTANVSGLADSAVRWSVNDVVGGDASVGTITQSNPSTYTAPNPFPASGSITVAATSVSDSSLSATATISPRNADLFALTVSITGGGKVTSSPPGIDCGSTCRASYPSGTTVTLTATPPSGSRFAGWSGACVGTGSCVVAMTGNKSVTAEFVTDGVTLTVQKTGPGTVASSPPGIDCGSACTASYPLNTVVTLTATPADGGVFSGWDGGGCGQDTSCTLTLTADVLIEAGFDAAPTPTRTLTVDRTGSGAGVVQSSPDGISCGDACSASFTEGTQVTLTASPALGSTFAGWSGGGCGGAEPCTITLTADTVVVAEFDAVIPVFTLAVESAGSGEGRVQSFPSGINCKQSCDATFPGGTPIVLTAEPDRDSGFLGWSGGGCQGTGLCNLILHDDTLVLASYCRLPKQDDDERDCDS